MRCLRSTGSLALTLALTAACGPDAVTASRAPEPPPVFDVNLAAPVPQILAATVVGRLDNSNSLVRITFTDTAEDEWLTSAYFTPTESWGSAVTRNIEGTLGTGERTVDVPAPTGYTTVRLHYLWNSPTGSVWSSFSAPVTIANVTAAIPKRKR